MKEKGSVKTLVLNQIRKIMMFPRDPAAPDVIDVQWFQVSPENIYGVHVVAGSDPEREACFRDVCRNGLRHFSMAISFPGPVSEQFLHDVAALVELLDAPVPRPLLLVLHDVGDYSEEELAAVQRLRATARKGLSLWLGLDISVARESPTLGQLCGDEDNVYLFVKDELYCAGLPATDQKERG